MSARVAILLSFATLAVLPLAACGGSGGGGDGVDTGLGFSVPIDKSASPQEQVRQYASGIFNRVKLEPALQSCVRANAEKADPAAVGKIEELSGDEQDATNHTLQAGFFKGCSLDAGKILQDGANDESKRLVAFTLRDELKSTLATRSDTYAQCISKGLDGISDDDLLALVSDPDKAKDIGSSIAAGCGSPAAG